MTEHASTDTDTMSKRFPRKKSRAIEGTPNMDELLRIRPYIRNCAKFHCITSYPVGLLHLAIPQPLYNMYIQHVYPALIAHPGPVPNVALNTGSAARETIRIQYAIALKCHEDENTMDDLLLEKFLDMLDEDKATYLRVQILTIVESTFIQVYNIACQKWGGSNPISNLANQTKMTAPWNVVDGIDVLFKRIKDARENLPCGHVEILHATEGYLNNLQSSVLLDDDGFIEMIDIY